jgi:hypothetical protein
MLPSRGGSSNIPYSQLDTCIPEDEVIYKERAPPPEASGWYQLTHASQTQVLFPTQATQSEEQVLRNRQVRKQRRGRAHGIHDNNNKHEAARNTSNAHNDVKIEASQQQYTQETNPFVALERLIETRKQEDLSSTDDDDDDDEDTRMSTPSPTQKDMDETAIYATTHYHHPPPALDRTSSREDEDDSSQETRDVMQVYHQSTLSGVDATQPGNPDLIDLEIHMPLTPQRVIPTVHPTGNDSFVCNAPTPPSLQTQQQCSIQAPLPLAPQSTNPVPLKPAPIIHVEVHSPLPLKKRTVAAAVKTEANEQNVRIEIQQALNKPSRHSPLEWNSSFRQPCAKRSVVVSTNRSIVGAR